MKQDLRPSPEATLQLSAEPLAVTQLMTPLGSQALRHAGAINGEHGQLVDEASSLTAGEISGTFKDSRSTLYEIGMDSGFQELCAKHNIDPYATEKPAYWSAFAHHTSTRVESLLQKNAANTPRSEKERQKTEVQLKALDLMASTPQYVFAKYKLSQQEQAGKRGNDTRQAKEIASRFNAKMRDFVTEHPATRASDMEAALLQVVSMAVENRNTRQVAAQLVNQTIRGMQHELGFGQLLTAIGYRFRPASMNEDLQGTDYVVDGLSGRPLLIDVKASMWKMDPGESPQPFKRGHSGNLIVYSMLRDHDLDDSFQVKPAIIEMKAPVVADMLRKAQAVA